jgi:outer membrane protein OmpA-like peptidoglycan-associated protein
MRVNALKNGRFAVMTASAALIALALAGCAGDEEAGGSAFTQALAKNYTDLTNQAAALPVPPEEEGGMLDSLDVFGVFSASNPNDALATAFEDKAKAATDGEEVEPEAAPSDATGQDIRARLVRGLANGKSQFPNEAAAAQANYDCWVLASAVSSAGALAQSCRSALATSLVTLENGARPAPPPMPAPMPVQTNPVPPPAPAPAADGFTVYFDFDSWTLTAEDLKVITDVINSARTGGQTHINIVGHTDTSGDNDYNQRLSLRRANVVVEALVDLGARRAAIVSSGVGENDLAVETGDGVKEAKNRRAVIGLQP